ncbi:peptidoglycan DD-metalloendopeptidase family protein [Streptomyces sp. NA04227]|uniref:LysM peptidoglycan-binding domain-containing M23 family metallopeptidase n=1 Tax=Streptomyces sp. NA04227 TaxID=2742136 RepID=UPI00158FC84A|nr:LysM peptidoglycan-binding domain-containing M23 family metallopeptidase [Streptomyces sp. NA04227]QKW10246.1 peptidoglycan DD-metalloendopeptidase family protein [Streptomyces sp. NA04227]
MPAKGKHRRPTSRRLLRTLAVASTGGAALALPLIGATGAHAAAAQGADVKQKSVTKAAEKPKKKAKKAPETYTVVPGDHLSKIAQEQHVSGGWKKLYADNREAIGSDPALIRPGLKLTLGAKAEKPQAPKKQAAPKKEAPKKQAKAAPAATGWTLPVAGSVGTPYHQSGSMWSSGYHTGVDFAVPTGTSLKAVGPATVVSAGPGGAYGNQVVLQLEDGRYAQYAHLSQISVSAGQSVSGGQEIGLSGATGNVTGPHLHFEIRTGPDYGSDIDPLGYLRAHGVTI